MRLYSLLLAALALCFVTNSRCHAQQYGSFGIVQTYNGTVAFAPQALNLAVNGQMLVMNKYSDVVDGTPYLFDEWQPGAIILYNNVVVENLRLKLNLLDNELYYKDSSGAELSAVTPVKYIVFKHVGNDTSAIFMAQQSVEFDRKGWFQVLATGKASLLKERTKKLIESKQYASATLDRSITTDVRYYVLRQGKLHLVKTVADVLAVLPEAAAGQKKNVKNEVDMKAVVDAFNRL
ncbi:MAG: hypothetical protein MUF62_02775 [Chitinophagaceae bacterium]|nr:hypothetical protein [Chitinophagaceae bacterium]